MVEQLAVEQAEKARQPQAYAWRVSQRERRLRLLMILPGLVASILLFQPSLNMGGDNAEYLVLARSLAVRHDYSAMGGPVVQPETKRPPGAPAFYAVLMMLFGERLWLLKTASLLTMMLSGWLAWPVLRMQAGSTVWATAAGVGLFLWNLQVLVCGVLTGSEMQYTALTLLALLAVARYVGHRDIRTMRVREAGWTPADEQHRSLWISVAIISTVAAIYVRPNGVTLLPALAIYLALHRQWRGLAISVVAATLLLAPLAVMQHRAASEGDTYGSYANTIETPTGRREMKGLGDFLLRTSQTAMTQTINLGELLVARPDTLALRPRPVVDSPEEVGQAVYLSPPAPGGDHLSLRAARYVARTVLGLLALLGMVVTWRGRGGVMHWYVLMNIVMLLLTPFPRGRYLLPLLPMFGWFLAMSFIWLARRLSRAEAARLGNTAIAGVLAAALFFTLVAGAQQTLINVENRGRAYYAPSRYAREGSDFVNYAAAADWVSCNAPANAVVICRKPYNMYWITNRPSTWGPLWENNPEALWHETVALARYGPVFIVQDGFVNRFHGDLTARNLLPAIEAHRSQLEPVLTLSAPRTVIWRLKSSRPSSRTAYLTP